MTVLSVEPGKIPKVIELENTLSAMQKQVGGLIQAIYPFEEPIALVCNEEGKLLGLPPNRCLRDEEGHIYDVVSGSFFLCAAPPDSEHFEGLTEEQLACCMERFRHPECFLTVNGQLVVLKLD